MTRFLFINSDTDVLSVSAEDLFSMEYESAGKIALRFKTVRSGLEGTSKVVLNVTSGKEQEVIADIDKQLKVPNKSLLYTDVALQTHEKNRSGTFITKAKSQATVDVLSIDSITHSTPASTNTTYAVSCVDGDNSDEEKIRLTGSDATTDDVVLEAGTGLTIARADDKITFTNSAPASSTLTQVYSQSFFDDISTLKHYLPFKDINEQSQVYQEEAAMLMPFDGKIRSVSIKGSQVGTGGNFTVGIETLPVGDSIFTSSNWNSQETEVLAFGTSDSNHVFHFVFDNAKHFDAGESCSISLQADADPGSNTYWHVTTVVDFDTTNNLGTSSIEHETTP